MATFHGQDVRFYAKGSDYKGDKVTAAISNYMSLLSNGEVLIGEESLTSAQKVKAVRGAIGTDGTHIYLAIISGASVLDTAYVMQTLGAKEALNLDGGGSAALYVNGSYRVGPGRVLPNAIVLVKI
jgi:exopolysaccharide biosynthesis protein